MTLTNTAITDTKTQIDDTTATKTHTVTVTLKKPDGTTSTTQTTDTTSRSNIIENQDETTKTVTQAQKKSTMNVSILAANDFTKPTIIPRYGVSVTKELIGPLTFGVFGVNNGVVGISLGLNF